MSTPCEFEFETVTVGVMGQLVQRSRHVVQAYIQPLAEGVNLELVAVPGGSFRMGASTSEEGCHPSQLPQHEVEIAPFWISRYPITQGQWAAVATLPPVKRPLTLHPACFSGDYLPVEQISWFDANEFCDRLSALTGQSYHLPSEAEWEYACRAGTETPFCFGPTLTTDLANYSGMDWEYDGKVCSKGSYGKGPTGEDRRQTTAVGSFQVANRFGLFDMHGLVREWCSDTWHDSYLGAPADGSAWITDSASPERVVRGGSWNSGPNGCRSAFRSWFDPNATLYDIGFRVVCRQVANLDAE